MMTRVRHGQQTKAAIRAWAAGKTNETTRDVGHRQPCSVLSPSRTVGRSCPALPGTIKVRHVSGRWSLLGLKSYQQGRGSFEGTAQHIIWLDEECLMDVYGDA